MKLDVEKTTKFRSLWANVFIAINSFQLGVYRHGSTVFIHDFQEVFTIFTSTKNVQKINKTEMEQGVEFDCT